MSLKIFNTLSRSVEEFVPLDPNGQSVGMYCCGPTVHNFAHIGNFRTFVFADLMRRYLEFKGFKVTHAMNITDVEDKIITAVRKTGRDLKSYTGEYEAAFLADFDALHCARPHRLPRATEHIAGIIQLIGALMERGIAYRSPDGSVYFSIEKYRASGACYGQLLKLNFDEMRPGERVSSDEYAKEAVADFALWKARVPDDGSIFWPSPWGDGRPGWHIECSAMSMELFGPSFDLHLGGEDLVFPHHEDEIAQSEGAGLQKHGHRFVKYWMHGAHLLVEGKKMAKSLGNYFTLRDLIGKGYSGREVRFLLLSSHYRESCNFTMEGLNGARTALARIDELLGKLHELAGSQTGSPDSELIERFTRAMDEDLNVSAAWGAIFEWVREKNRMLAKASLSAEQAADALSSWKRINSVLALPFNAMPILGTLNVTLAAATLTATGTVGPLPEILEIVNARQTAKSARDFRKADELRAELKTKGWLVEDTPSGPKLKKV